MPGTRPGGRAAHALRTALGPLLFGVAYCVLQRLTFGLRFPTQSVCAFWSPGALLLTALLLAPRKQWGRYGVALLLAVLVAYANDPVYGMSRSLPCAPVYFAAAAASAGAIRRFGGVPLFRSLRSHAVFIAVGGVLYPLSIAAWWSVMQMLATGRPLSWLFFSLKALAVSLPVMMITPGLTLAMMRGMDGLRPARGSRYLEAACLAAALLMVGRLTFGGTADAGTSPALLYAPLPVLMWAAVRFGAPGIGAALATLSVISIIGVIHGRGPFVADPVAENLLQLQVFLLAISLPLKVLAALMDERRRTARALVASEQRSRRQLAQLATIYRTAPVGLVFFDTDLRYVNVNDQMAEFNGLPVEAHLGRTLREVLPDLADQLEPLYREVIRTGIPIIDREVVDAPAGPPGARRHWLSSYYPVGDERGVILGVNAVVKEITERKLAEEALQASHEQIQDLAGRLITAQEAERSRIARELHDDVTQQIAALAIDLSGLKRRLTAENADLAAALGRLQRQTVGLAETVRHLSHELHPGVLKYAGLVAALKGLTSDFERRHQIPVTFHATGELADLRPDVAVCLYRVAQEALRNTGAHAAATQARVAVTRQDDEVELTISDWGRGFDPAAARCQAGMGLISIEERVRLMRGKVRIDSLPHWGTFVQIQLPVQDGSTSTGEPRDAEGASAARG